MVAPHRARPTCVLDTNVLVSALLRPGSIPHAIFAALDEGLWIPAYNGSILDEYRMVLGRSKFSFDSEDVEAILEAVLCRGEYVRPAPWPWPHKLPDPTDAVFLATAEAAGAAHIVTGNTKHFPPASRRKVSVISSRDFAVELGLC